MHKARRRAAIIAVTALAASGLAAIAAPTTAATSSTATVVGAPTTVAADGVAAGTTPPPSWAKDLVVYEVNPRGFTSPNGVGDGNGSGTFTSLRTKFDYLQSLGVNGIWLAGFQQATNHFYGIWSNYADVDPTVMDPKLGTRAEFKAMIDDAHAHGIKIFLDVITHGVVNESPLITQHPTWFQSGGSWGMRDYNYADPGFRAWWKQTWVDYVMKDGVDGYRLDLQFEDRAMWDDITATVKNAGRPIVVFPENEHYHFQQRNGLAYENFSTDIAAEWKQTQPTGTMTASVVSHHDKGWESAPGNYYEVKGSRAKFGYDTLLSHHIPLFFGGEEFNASQVSLPALKQYLYGGGGPGGWMYGQQMQWSDLNDPAKAAMLADVTKLIKIRRENADLINADVTIGQMMAVPTNETPNAVPYVRYQPGQKGIVVVGNYNASSAANLTLQVPLTSMGLAGKGSYKVTDLWTNTVSTVSEAALGQYAVSVPADNTPGGGVRAYKIEPAAPVATVTTDDGTGGTTYSSGFTKYQQPWGHYLDGVTGTNSAGQSLQRTFTGTGVTWITQRAPDSATVDVYLDGAKVSTVNLANPGGRRFQQVGYSVSGLTNGSHTLKIVNTSGSWLVDDAIVTR